MIHPTAYIDRLAFVDRDKCRVGAGTWIHRFSSVTRGTVLGEDCVVWPLVNLDGPIIGDRCKIASGVVMGAGFKVGNDVFIGPNVTFANDLWPEANSEGFDYGPFREGRFTIVVENNAAIGANVLLKPGVIIRAGALIEGGAVVDSGTVVPENMLYLRTGVMKPIPSDRRARRMRLLPEETR